MLKSPSAPRHRLRIILRQINRHAAGGITDDGL